MCLRGKCVPIHVFKTHKEEATVYIECIRKCPTFLLYSNILGTLIYCLADVGILRKHH